VVAGGRGKASIAQEALSERITRAGKCRNDCILNLRHAGAANVGTEIDRVEKRLLLDVRQQKRQKTPASAKAAGRSRRAGDWRVRNDVWDRAVCIVKVVTGQHNLFH